MLTGKARIIARFGFVVLLLGGAIAGWYAVSPPVAAADSKESRVKELLKEELAALKEIASQHSKNHQSGHGSASQVYVANQAVRQVELALCDTDKERIAIMEKMLAEARANEKSLQAAALQGGSPSIAALHAKVARLEIEIALERARGK